MSINAYLPEEQCCQMSSLSELKRRSLRLFRRALPKHEQQEQQDE